MRRELEISKKQRCWSLVTDVTYAQVSSWYDASVRDMKLSILMPKSRSGGEKYPLLVWICGGAFRVMDRNVWIPQWTEFARSGYIVASVEYRTGNEAPFPAALEDVKAAIRYLRANAGVFGIDPEHVFVSGESAGGCLACLTGVCRDKARDVGMYLEQSSQVQGVIDFYGVTDFMMTPDGREEDVPVRAIEFIENSKEKAEGASACGQVDSDTPPFLILHGDQDALVPLAQSEKLYQELCEKGIPADFYVLKGCGHGADEFYQKEILEIVREFIEDSGRSGSRTG